MNGVTIDHATHTRLEEVERIVRAYFLLRDGIPLPPVNPMDTFESSVGKRILALFAEGRK